MLERIPLTAMRTRETGEVVEIAGGMGILRRLASLGIRHGVKVIKVSGAFARGPVVLRVGGTQAVLGFGVASRVIVKVSR